MKYLKTLFIQRFRVLFFVLGVVFFAQSCIAQSDQTNAERRFYFGVNYGAGSSSIRLNRMFGTGELEDCQNCRIKTDIQPRSFIIGVDFSKYQSLKITYIDFDEVFSFSGTVAGQEVDINQQTYGFVVTEKLSYPLGRQIKLYGQFGAIFWNSKVYYYENGVRIGENTDNDIQLAYGMGLAYSAYPSLTFSIEYNRYSRLGDSSVVVVSGNLVETLDMDIETLGFSIEYYFR